MPLYFAGDAAPSSTVFPSIFGPAAYRDRWALTFGVKSPAVTVKGAKISAFGDLFVPVATRDVRDPAAAVLNSRAVRVGIVAAF